MFVIYRRTGLERSIFGMLFTRCFGVEVDTWLPFLTDAVRCVQLVWVSERIFLRKRLAFEGWACGGWPFSVSLESATLATRQSAECFIGMYSS